MAQEIADSTLLDTWGSGGNIVEPDISKIIEGWQLGEQPPHEYMNWLQNTFGSKLNHILKNGVASWNNETEYLAGSSVQHNGNVWLCKTTNTNSEPADVNANWKRTITVESLTTVLNGYVATTGDQTISGVKTFTSSPIVPTPTTGTQVANKNYVDSVATLNINGLTEKTTPVDTDNLALQETGGLLKKLSWANLKATLFDGARSLTTNGYIKLPSLMGGLIIQWGTNNTGGAGGDQRVSVTFPIAYPNDCFIVVPSWSGLMGATPEGVYAINLTINGFTLGHTGDNPSSPAGWISIGY